MSKSSLKILQVLDYFSRKLGGPVHNVYNLSKKLTEFGHEVTVCSTDFAFDGGYIGSDAGFHLQIFPCKGPFKYSPAMRGWLDKNIGSFDVVHGNNYWNYQNVIASAAARKISVPFILSPRGSLPIQMKSYAIKYLFDLFFGRKVLDRASIIVGTTEMEIDQILAKGQPLRKTSLIPNAVGLPPDNIDDPTHFKYKYGIPKNNEILLFLGRIHKIKGVDLLVKAFSAVAKKRSDLTLVIAGPEDWGINEVKDAICSEGLKERVVFTGPLYGKDKYTAYNSATIYILPSRYEIFGNTILEACACSTPVIITDRCGISPKIANIAGEVVRFDVTELSAAIEKLLSDKSLREKYGSNGRSLVEKKYTWDKVAKQFEDIYRKAIERR